MTATYKAIATTTLGSAASSITFSSIDGSYTDIILVLNHSSESTSGLIVLDFNSDTTNNNYSGTVMIADSGGTSSTRYSGADNVNQHFISWARTEWTTTLVNINNYSNSTTFKTFITRNSNASGQVGTGVFLWRNTNAITSITVKGSAVNLAAGTMATLYGIKAE